MKTFEDIVFKPHSVGEGLHGRIFFDNGYGLSVVRFSNPFGRGGYMSRTSNEDQWEVAVLFGNEKEWELTYNTPITNDVIGYLSSDEVTEIMKKVQEL